jgi:Zn-dependent protease with chaperone function
VKRFAIGITAGANAAYVLVRAFDALRELREPARAAERDARAYGDLRRGLMLAGTLRSLAALYASAYGLGPLLAMPKGEPEPRARRIALTTFGFLASSVADLPVDFAEGFAVERRYALSTQTPDAWLADRAKSTAVSLAIALPLLEGLSALIARAPRRWPLLATAATLPLLVLANVIAPNLIMPLFNRFEKLEGELEPQIRELAARYGAGDAAILRMDMSARTVKANAFVTGLFGSKRIVIGDTLLANFERRETLFVVAHELGHYVTRDVWRSVALGTLAAAVTFSGARRIALAPGDDGRELATTAGLGRLAFAMSVIGTLLGPLLAAASRSRERAADGFALAATGDPHGGAAAFSRLRDQNLAEDEQPRWMEVLFSSHPSLRSRIDRLERAAAER